jgi:hypothetical protein
MILPAMTATGSNGGTVVPALSLIRVLGCSIVRWMAVGERLLRQRTVASRFPLTDALLPQA